MKANVQAFNKFTAPRIAQLSQRSNQFNFRTIRLTESEVNNFELSDDYFTLSFTLEDKFGDHGLISTMILQKRENHQLFIHSWLMSCRVLNRTMENFILNTIAELGRERGFGEIVGQYIPTTKNSLVKDFFENNGFRSENGEWHLKLDNYLLRKTFIKSKN
jgi:FkbH-like protein